MRNEIKADKTLFDNTIKYLRWSYETANAERMTGANGCDIIIGSMAASVMIENNEQMLDYKAKMTSLLTIQLSEGILANPNCESNNPDVINVKIQDNGKLKNLSFQMPTGVNSGSSVTHTLNDL